MAICPECEFEIDVDEYDVDRGDTLECDNCGVTLEIIGLNPIELEVAAEDDEEHVIANLHPAGAVRFISSTQFWR